MNESVAIQTAAINMPPPPRTKWEREHAAFCRLLPQLLTSYRGLYVAIHNEQVADNGNDKIELALRVWSKIGNVPIHIGLVTDVAEPLSRSGVRRETATKSDGAV